MKASAENLQASLKYLEVPFRKKAAHMLCVPEPNVEFSLYWDGNLQCLTAALSVWELANDLAVAEVNFPSNWVEALKDRWLPMRLRKIWPVRYTKVTLAARDYYNEVPLPRLGRSVRTLEVETVNYEDSEPLQDNCNRVDFKSEGGCPGGGRPYIDVDREQQGGDHPREVDDVGDKSRPVDPGSEDAVRPPDLHGQNPGVDDESDKR